MDGGENGKFIIRDQKTTTDRSRAMAWTWNSNHRIELVAHMLVKKALDALKYFIIKPYLRNPSGFFPVVVSFVHGFLISPMFVCAAADVAIPYTRSHNMLPILPKRLFSRFVFDHIHEGINQIPIFSIVLH